MKILICTVFDIDVPCAALNRLTKMSKGLAQNGINSTISLGSGSEDLNGKAWKYKKDNEQKYILYNKSLFSVLRHCNAMRIAGTATKF